jgi:hypothetical protein
VPIAMNLPHSWPGALLDLLIGACGIAIACDGVRRLRRRAR